MEPQCDRGLLEFIEDEVFCEDHDLPNGKTFHVNS